MFEDIYDRLESEMLAHEVGEDGLKHTTRFDGITLKQFAEWMADKVKTSIIVETSFLDKQLVMDVFGESTESLIHLAARQAGAGLSRIGSAYVIGTVQPEDYGILVRRVPNVNREDLGMLMTAIGSGQGRIYVGEDGMTVVADSMYALTRIAEALEQVASSKLTTWIVQLQFLTETEHENREASAGVELDASYSFGRASTLGVSRGALDYAFDSWLRAKASKNTLRLSQAPMVLLVEGSRALVHSGRNIPVPKKSVSDSGTVSTTDYEIVRDGLDLDLIVRDGGNGAGLLEIKLSVGQIEGYVDDSPIVAEKRIETKALVKSRGIYLLGSLDSHSTTADRQGFVSMGSKKGREDGRTEVWGRVYRIGGESKR